MKSGAYLKMKMLLYFVFLVGNDQTKRKKNVEKNSPKRMAYFPRLAARICSLYLLYMFWQTSKNQSFGKMYRVSYSIGERCFPALITNLYYQMHSIHNASEGLEQ